MLLDLAPDIETAIRRRAQREGVSVEELLARAFPPSSEDGELHGTAASRRRRRTAAAEWDTEDTWRAPDIADSERDLWRSFELEHR